ncbi:ATP-binding protein [Paraburkholderia bryophila]|uniref:ATP-binding protein n=1 Tax=Paraburkholderia bryophila TaxID=420952 RepID=UPI00234A4776|nr:ATP-binding protein [Paraburkholderia bryophila]WCM23949.1 ATP-binding protein [Paraburkholderia bryophila]
MKREPREFMKRLWPRLLPRALTRLWPDTLYGRLVLILVVGMFGGQLFTSTIWFETHDNRTLEIPARLFASRLADTVRLLQHAPDDAARRAIIGQLGDERYRLKQIDAPVAAPVAAPVDHAEGQVAQYMVGNLLSGVIARRLREPVDVRLLDAHLRDESGHHTGMLSLFNSRMPTGDFHVQLKVPNGPWLDVEANEGQAGMQTQPWSLVLDYLLRIYFVRFTAVFLLALVAVRFAVRPLRELAKAAEALGRNIYRPPLPVSGPREVRTAAQSFNTMQTQLTDGLAERTRFLTAVSHDLRSPLTRLRLRAEMLPDPAWRERLRSDLDEMEAMVRMTLDAVQGVEITETRHDIDLDSMLDSIAADACEAGHTATVEGNALRPFPGYPRNLKRCLQNLVDNAIRYGGQASIKVTDMAGEVRIVIGDNGPGIADGALRERVFEPYFRIAAHGAAETAGTSATTGTGLGLTIARSIAAAHGGTLVLRNRSSGGLDAVLTLRRDS